MDDSTDWLETPLACLGRVDSALRCQVCKEFFDNPVITSCSHTFCSLCIRRCLSADGKCPACRSGDQELKLRRNGIVQELVDSFVLSRPTMLGFAKDTAAAQLEPGAEDDTEGPVSKRRKLDKSGKEDVDVPSDNRRKTRSQGKRTEVGGLQENSIVIEDSQGEDSGDGDFEPDDGLVACPVCGRRMKNEFVFVHLDTCTGSRPAKSPANAMGPLRYPFGTSRAPCSPSQNPSRLPTINYSILKENALRKKLHDLGIPDWGLKPLLQRRHTEWVNLWNANCDAVNPKSKRQLLQELDTWEKTQGGAALGQNSSVMKKDFDSSAWSTTHGDGYKELIAKATKKKAITNPAAGAASDHQVELIPQSTDDMQANNQRDEEPVPDSAAEHQVEKTDQITADTQTEKLRIDEKDNRRDKLPPASLAVEFENDNHLNSIENHEPTETNSAENPGADAVGENVGVEDVAT